jgi:hypothetical protein
MLASSLKTSLMASANRSSTRFESRVHAPALCLPRGRRLVVTSGHCAGTYLIPFYLEGVSTMIVCVTCRPRTVVLAWSVEKRTHGSIWVQCGYRGRQQEEGIDERR